MATPADESSSSKFRTLFAPMIAKAYEVLKISREAGDLRDGVVALIVAARIIERDMLDMCATPPPEDRLKLLEQATRLEIEKIFTAGWTRQ